MAEVASRYPTSKPEEGDTLGQLDSLHSEPTEQERVVVPLKLQPGVLESGQS